MLSLYSFLNKDIVYQLETNRSFTLMENDWNALLSVKACTLAFLMVKKINIIRLTGHFKMVRDLFHINGQTMIFIANIHNMRYPDVIIPLTQLS